MLNKSLIWIFVFVLSLSVVSALVVTQPTSSSLNNSVTVNWTSEIASDILDTRTDLVLGTTEARAQVNNAYFKAKQNISFYGWAGRASANDGTNTGYFRVYKNGVNIYNTSNITLDESEFYNFTFPIINLTTDDYIQIATVSLPSAMSQCGNYNNNPYVDKYSTTEVPCEDSTELGIYFNAKAITNKYDLELSNGVSLGSVSLDVNAVQNATYQQSFSLYPLNLSIGQYFVRVNASSNGNSNIANNVSANFSVDYNSQMNVSARLGGVLFSNYFLNVSNGSTVRSFTTTNGIVPIDVVRGVEYNFTFYANNMITSSSVFTITNVPYNTLNFTVYLSATLVLTLKEESNLALVTQNITVTLTDITNPKITTSSTTSGNITFSNIAANGDTVEVKTSSANFSSARYYVTILDQQINNLTIYLLRSSVAQNVSFCFYDENGAPISDLHFYQFLLSNSSYLLVQDVYTSIQGRATVQYNPSSYYLYNYSNSDYITRPFILNPPSNTLTLSDGCNYDLTLQFADQGITYVTKNVTGSSSFNNNTNIVTFNYNSSDPTLSPFSYTVSKIINAKAVVICSGSSTDLSHSFNCSVSGYDGTVFVQGIAGGSPFYFDYIFIGLDSLQNRLGTKNAAFIAGIIASVIVFGATIGGVIAVLFGGVIALIVIAWLGLLTIISGGMIAAAIVVAIVIASVLKRR